jgi:hypothetical protein
MSQNIPILIVSKTAWDELSVNEPGSKQDVRNLVIRQASIASGPSPFKRLLLIP